MPVQELPICFECSERIETDVVYEAPCGHETCRSACFHGLCLMTFRERRESASDRFEIVGLLIRPWLKEHSEAESEAS